MKCIMNPRPDIQEELIKPYKEMEDVYSLSCVVGDAMEREQVMRHDMKPKSINKKIIGPAITVKLTAGDIVDCLCVFEIARPGDVIVIDAFGGSGTTMVACQQLKRKARVIEYDPKYCDVIVNRMIKLDDTLTVKRNGVDVTNDWK